MRFGAVFPTCEIGNDPIVIRDFAQTAEGLGYAHILIYDHVLGAVHEHREPPLWGPYTECDPFHEPFVLFGYLAAVTSTIELATGVLILPQRQTALVAKQAAEIDVLSGGRLRLGVGTGWNYVEYDCLGTAFEDRGSRLDEQIEVLRAMWRAPVVSFHGQHHRIDRAGILPQPTGHIPLWFGGGSKPSFRRAAHSGDGFMFGSAGPRVVAAAASLLEAVEDEGRDASAFGLEALVDFSKGPERWTKDLADWRAAGGTHFSMRAMNTAATFLGVEPPGFTTPTEHIRALETFMNEVGGPTP